MEIKSKEALEAIWYVCEVCGETHTFADAPCIPPELDEPEYEQLKLF